jgi:hypothetical protein
VGDEVLTRLAPLVGVALAGEAECVLDRGAIEPVLAVGAVLADDREQVPEQRPFADREVLGDVVDRRGSAGRGVLGTDPGVSAAVRRAGCPVPRVELL